MVPRALAFALAFAALAAPTIPAAAEGPRLVVAPDGAVAVQMGTYVTRFARIAGPDTGGAPADPRFWGPDADWTGVAVAPDGRLVALGTRDGAVALLGADGAVLARAQPSSGRIQALAFAPGGGMLAVGTTLGEAVIYGIAREGGGPPRLVEHRRAKLAEASEPRALVFTPDERHVYATDGELLVSVALADGAPAVLKGRKIAAAVAAGGGLVVYETGKGFLKLDPRRPTFAPFGPRLDLGERPLVAGAPRGGVAALTARGTLVALAADGRVLARREKAALPVPADDLDPVGALAVAADGDRIATIGRDGVVRFWARDGRPLGTAPGVGATDAAQFLPDGALLVAARSIGRLKRWDAAGGAGAAIGVAQSALGPMRLAGGGRVLVVGEKSGRLALRAAGDFALLAAVAAHEGEIAALAVSADGALVATGGEDETVRLWRLDGTTLAAAAPPMKGHFGAVAALVFSADGQRLMSGGVDGTLRLWRRDGGAIGGAIEATEARVAALAPGRDGAVVAMGDDKGFARLYDWDGKPASRTIRVDPDYVGDLVLTPDGRGLVVSGADGIRHWAVDGRALGRAFSRPSILALAPDGETIVALSHEGVVRFWTAAGAARRAPLAIAPAPPTAIGYSPDGQALLVGDQHGLVRRLDLATFRFELATTSHVRDVVAIAAAGAAGPIYTVDRGGAILAWKPGDLATPAAMGGGSRYLWSFAVAPDGAHLAIGDREGYLRVWSADGTLRAEARPAGDNIVFGVGFAAPNELVAVYHARDAYIHWHGLDLARTRPAVRHPFARLDSFALSAAFGRVVLGSEQRGYAVHAIDARGFVSAPIARRDAGNFSAAAISPADGAIAVGTGPHRYGEAKAPEGTIEILAADGAVRAAPFPAHAGGITALAFAPDGKSLASIGRDGAIRFWTLDGKPIRHVEVSP